MPTESVRILIETNAAQIREEILGLGSSISSLGPSVSGALPELEEARAALESLEDTTDSYIETLSNGDIPTKLESIGSAAGKATAALAAFAGGLKIGQTIGDIVFQTERWNAELDLANSKTDSLVQKWVAAKRERFDFGIEDAGGDMEALKGQLKGVRSELDDKARVVERLQKAMVKLRQLESLPLGKQITTFALEDDPRQRLKTALAEKQELERQEQILSRMTSFRAKEKQAAQEKLEAEKKASTLIKEQVKFQQKRDANFAKSFLFGDDFDQAAISDGERKAETAFKERQRESERQRKEGIRDRIQSFRDELSELKKVGGAAALQGRDDRLGSGRANPLDAIAAADAKAAAERKAQLETLIKGQEALLKAQKTGPTINVNGP